ncbi:Transcriptional regulator of acetoin/glycerol metabolism [Pseudonocardia ammonioxydans]|uniref:Transcriptional regulator of acetoin/glycerol metabolism n=2 Tax=Pseudonocardia ammonioxydans TaxID=260086 RepID=A0A1I4YFH6_PSUAM|nr:Transcriptional regulator of acetoin/glycerol metabolism [Pseudonocardia ammonioxydans]
MAARERLLGASTTQPETAASALVRSEIVTSWRRSQLNGIDPGAPLTLPHDPEREGAPRLLRAAEPVLQRLSADLSNTVITLADSSSWILWRASADKRLLTGLDQVAAMPGSLLAEEVAGTNGLGTVLEVRGPVIVAGPEHFLEGMQDFTCVGVPVRDPFSRRLEGIVALTCHYRDTNEHLLPLVAEAAKEIEDRLRLGSSTRERALFDAFVRTARSPALAVASMNEEYLFTNAQAAQLFDPSDHARLWDWAQEAMRSRRTMTGRVTLSRGFAVDVRCSTVHDGPTAAGVLLTMRSTPGTQSSDKAPKRQVSTPEWWKVREAGLRLFRARRRVAVLGEGGAGKATLARALHDATAPRTPLIEIDFAVDGISSFVDGHHDPSSTFLLHHVDCLPRRAALELAARLERAAARVLLAVDPDVVEAAVLGRLLDRTDGAVTIPPLRERRQDLPGLVSALLRDLGADSERRCTSGAITALMHHDLPGNVAELRRVLSTALATSTSRDIGVDDLPPTHRTVTRDGRKLIALEEAERATIVDALQSTGWNAESAAEHLGISRATIYRKMKALSIRRPVQR